MDTIPKTRVRRRVNGFALTHHGRLLVQSIRRYKIDCLNAGKVATGAPTWQDLYRARFRMVRVQVLVMQEVNARHGNTGRKRKRKAGV